ncbi:N-acetyltransferase family protein [Vibrio sp. WJH972]
MDFRVAQYSDYEQIARMQAENWKNYYRDIMSADYLLKEVEDDRKMIWQTRLTNQSMNQHVIVFENNGSLCGFVCAFGNHDFEKGSIIESLNVAPEYQSQGCRQRLLVEMTKWIGRYFPDSGIYVEIGEQNTEALAYYSGLGGISTSKKVWDTPCGASITERVFTWETPQTLLDAIGD